MTTSNLIELSNVSVQKGRSKLLSSVSLVIKDREITTIIGPNGGGKTTLVRVILGLQSLTKGQIKRQKSLSIGYMPQKIMVQPTLPITVRRFLTLNNGKVTPENLDKVEYQVGINHLTKQSVHSLSGGEWQRVLLARALLTSPNVLILDEPMQGIDVVGQEKLYHMLDTIRKEYRCAIVLVSHDLHFVMSASDQVVCLNQHICCHGAPEVVTTSSDYQKLFGKSTVSIYQHHHDHNHDGMQAKAKG